MKLLARQMKPGFWLRVINNALLIAVCLVVLGLGYMALAGRWGYDVSHFWSGARTLLDGSDPYRALHVYPGVAHVDNEQFHPLPWVGLMFAPLALLPFETAKQVWAAVNLVLLVLILIHLYRRLRTTLPGWELALIGLGIVWLSIRNLNAGQISLFVTCTVLFGVDQLLAARPIRSGLLFSLALFKPWIAIGTLVAVLALIFSRRQWKFLIGLLSGGLIMIIITTLLWPNWLASYLQVDFSQALGVKVGDQYVSYWPVSTLFDFARYGLGWSLDGPLAFLLGGILVGAAASLAVAAYRCWRRGQLDDLTWIGIATLLGLLVIPYSRYYDYCMLTIWLIGVVVGGVQSKLPRWSLGLITCFVAMAFLLTTGSFVESWAYQILFWLYGSSWLIIGLSRRREVESINRRVVQTL